MKIDIYLGGVESCKTPKTLNVDTDSVTVAKEEVKIKLQSGRYVDGDYDIIITDENDDLIGGFWTEKKCGSVGKFIKWG